MPSPLGIPEKRSALLQSPSVSLHGVDLALAGLQQRRHAGEIVDHFGYALRHGSLRIGDYQTLHKASKVLGCSKGDELLASEDGRERSCFRDELLEGFINGDGERA